jgi:hypothetical protein
MTIRRTARLLLAVMIVCVATAARAIADTPETVVITLHAKAGASAELEKVIAKHWETAVRLNLVVAAPHLTIRGEEQGNQVFLMEVLTWRDASVPDHAPPEIQAIWAEMNRLVEPRLSRPGLTIDQVMVIAR